MSSTLSKTQTDSTKRCAWVHSDSPRSIAYHDHEWGVPATDDRTLFEFLILEGAQAGLSWETILARRAGYRSAFYNFDPVRVARLTEKDITRLRGDETIIRNEKKIRATRKNAHAFLRVQKECGSFVRYLWSWVDHTPVQNKHPSIHDIPATTPLATTISTDLKARGFSFVGPTIIYAYLQAVGVVNDHTIDCFRYQEVRNLAPFAQKAF